MNILFITSTRIGDAVLSSGLLDYIDRTFPQARVTIACGPLATSLFEGYPKLERIIPMKKKRRAGHWRQLWIQVVGTRWDIVIDLRNSVASRLIRTDKLYVHGPHISKRLHKVEQNAAVLALSPPPEPKLWFTSEQMERAKKLLSPPTKEMILAVGPTANWIGKTWPAERFIEIIKFLRGPEGKMPGARVAVFAAPGEEEPAYKVLNSVPAEQQIDMIAKTTPGEAAAALSLCDFYIGNDSGLMHCAAAVGVPTFGLFGPSYPHIYRPWGEHTAYAQTPETFDELTDYENYSPETCGCLMESLKVETVKEKLEAFMKRELLI